MLWRGLKGAILGATLAAAVAVALTALLFGFGFAIAHPVDRANDLKHLMEFLTIATLAGAAIGAVGGLAAKLPRKGIRMLTSIGIVAGCAVLGRLPAMTQLRYKGSPEPSYIPAIIAALVGGTLVLVYGVVVSKREGKKAEGTK